jgi:superfamily II DNA helicase RecQ
MALHFFTIRALDPEPEQAAFNAFCQSARVLRVERHFVPAGPDSFWALCVDVAEGQAPLPDALKHSNHRRPNAAPASGNPNRPDYKQLLSERDFIVFAALRQWRKARSEADGLPLFAVFTNEQLAEIAQRRCSSAAALGEIDGIGPARIERYGPAVLACLAALPAEAAP